MVSLGFFEHDSLNDSLRLWSLNPRGKCVQGFCSIFLFFTGKRFVLMVALSQVYGILGDLKLNRLDGISVSIGDF